MHWVRSSKRSSGFTLIELLVVIAIIAILSVVVVFDRVAGKVYAYVNGVKQSNSIDISSVTGNVSAVEGVQMASLAGWQMKGSMDDVRMYTKALSAAEIQALYNSEK